MPDPFFSSELIPDLIQHGNGPPLHPLGARPNRQFEVTTKAWRWSGMANQRALHRWQELSGCGGQVTTKIVGNLLPIGGPSEECSRASIGSSGEPPEGVAVVPHRLSPYPQQKWPRSFP